jgi:hypothetical protein
MIKAALSFLWTTQGRLVLVFLVFIAYFCSKITAHDNDAHGFT